MIMEPQFGVFYQVFRKNKAVRFALENFRKHFPENPIVLISDAGDDFSDYAEEFNCIFNMCKDNIFGPSLGYHNYPGAFNSIRMLEWWSRQKMVCEATKMDYVMIMEDDVYVREPFDIQAPFALRGVQSGDPLQFRLLEDIKNSSGLDGTNYGMCGGSIYNANIFLEIYDDVVEDIKENMDRRLIDNYDEWYLLTAVDANITYHYNKKGHKYEAAPWLGQVCEGNTHLPVVHQWKEHY